MTYPEALEYLEGLDRRGIKPGLERIGRLLELAGHPERAYPSVLVGGTNGKGSTTAFLTHILMAAGYRVGSAPKPHLVTPRERLQVGCPRSGRWQLCPEAAFGRLVGEVVPWLDRVAAEPEAGPPSYFEVMTLLALLWFARQRVDWAVVEVGLGGRLDATNVLDPAAIKMWVRKAVVETRAREDQQIDLLFDMSKSHVFDKETEEAVY